MFAIAELDAGDVDAARAHAERARELSAGLDLHLPAALAAAPEPRSCSRHRRRRRDRARGATVDGRARCRRRLQAAFSRQLLGRALAAAGAEEAIEELREAERELDAAARSRARRGPA